FFCYAGAIFLLLFLGLIELLPGNNATPDEQLCNALFHANLAIGKSQIILNIGKSVNKTLRRMKFYSTKLDKTRTYPVRLGRPPVSRLERDRVSNLHSLDRSHGKNGPTGDLPHVLHKCPFRASYLLFSP